METHGLLWLARQWPCCVTFVRGISEDQVFKAFGANPDEAVVRRLGEPLDATEAIPSPVVRVGRAGDWVIAIEDGWSTPQGVRPEVLRRVSSGGAAVAVYEDIGKLNHEFGYAADGDVIAALTTCMPPHWSGSDPGWFESFARDLSLAYDPDGSGEPTNLESVLLLAESAFGLSLTQADLDRPLRCARVLPVMADLPLRPPADQVYRIGDPVIDALLKWSDPQALAAVAAIRIRRLMAATGLDAYPELAEAVETALAGEPRQPTDDSPVGRSLRQLAQDRVEAEQYLASLVNGVRPPVPAAELRRRVRRGYVAALLRFVLDGRPAAQLLAGEFQKQRIWDSKGWQEPLAWRAQAIADFGDVKVPAAELRAAEEAWLAVPEPVRGRVALIDAAPVRAHVNALIASGMDDRRIAELSGRVTTGFIDLLLHGSCTQVSVTNARSVLAIPVSDDPPPGDDG